VLNRTGSIIPNPTAALRSAAQNPPHLTLQG
jgi:hypothetical protein